jgi:hypothetical protein
MPLAAERQVVERTCEHSMSLTDAQIALVGHLIGEAMSDEAAAQRRWDLPTIAAFVRARAEAGQLLLVRDWTADVVLSPNGDVIVIDTEDGQPPRLATDRERCISLFRSIAKYPELLSLLPQRPAEAINCPGCSGTGILVARFAKPELRHIVCRCGGSGWITPEESEQG